MRFGNVSRTSGNPTVRPAKREVAVCRGGESMSGGKKKNIPNNQVLAAPKLNEQNQQ